MKVRKIIQKLICFSIIFIFGFLSSIYYDDVKQLIKSNISWDNTVSKDFPKEITEVSIRSSVDRNIQMAMFYSSTSFEEQPLIVSLHSWSGNYQQSDPLAKYVINENWNFIHPDFRGPNTTTEAGMSNLVLSDIDDAISYAIKNSKVDTSRIIIVGASGGGLATIGAYLRSKHKLLACIAWVPITDMLAWYNQSRFDNSKYFKDIVSMTNNNKLFDSNEIIARSPYHWDIKNNLNGSLMIFAGINDGYQGSVSIIQSINFYNKIIEFQGDTRNKIHDAEIIDLISRNISLDDDYELIENREVLFSRRNQLVSLTIFNGAHEMLSNYCFELISNIIKK